MFCALFAGAGRGERSLGLGFILLTCPKWLDLYTLLQPVGGTMKHAFGLIAVVCLVSVHARGVIVAGDGGTQNTTAPVTLAWQFETD